MRTERRLNSMADGRRRPFRWRWALILLSSSIQLVASSYHERRLYEDLMRDYNNLERPVANHSQPVTVYLKVSLQQLIDVDEKNQVVLVNAWLDYAWHDYKLMWDKNEYGNITDVRFPAGKIWRPDVLLYNSVDPNFDSTYPTNLIVYNTGDVSWVPPGIFKISCKIDIKWFPMDSQKCFFKFGSWTYAGSKLDLQPAKGGFDISEYMSNGEWSLPLTTTARSEKFYDCCPDEPYPGKLNLNVHQHTNVLDVTFYLHMKRRTLYYGFNLIMPCILTTAMTLLGFTLPSDAGEKITLQITVLLSICFFLSMLSEMSPPTSEAVPLLGVFFSSCLIIVTLSTCFTVYVINLHYRTPETHEMTPMVFSCGLFKRLPITLQTRTVLLYWLPYLLRIERPGIYLSWETLPSIVPWSKPKRHSESLIRNVKQVEDGSRNSIDIERQIQQYITGISNGGTAAAFKTIRNGTSTQHSLESTQLGSVSPASDSGNQAILVLLQKISFELKTITKRMMEEERETSQANSWKFAAMVVDRLCLYIFSFLLVGTIAGILVAAPYLSD
ncbi:Acetylcholine receptor subunit alpha-type acr-16 [Aphelenchoides besseyi]|nr:Acetylcholine receptor subunit alpha-type acr-16 [Aphelenchoides besseyi]